MTNAELETCLRFKHLRQSLKIKQQDFAKELAISQGHASDIENGRKAVSDRIVELLVLKYNVSESWLRTGEGEMFTPLSRSETIAHFAGELMKEEDGSFRRQLVEVLAQLDEHEWEVLEGIAKKLALKKD